MYILKKNDALISILLSILKMDAPHMCTDFYGDTLFNVYSKNWCTGASIFTKGHIGYSRGFLSDRIEIKLLSILR
jgi:hypothetical protein